MIDLASYLGGMAGGVALFAVLYFLIEWRVTR